MNKLALLATAMLLADACSKPQAQQPASRTAGLIQPQAARDASRPAGRQASIDPKSNEAAEQLVTGFARLLDGGHFDQAYMLLGPSAPPRSSFDAQFTRLRHLHVTVGLAGDQQGAAGSIYVAVPMTSAGMANGKRLRRSGNAVLRRVNDVPGSTEAQRHWRIERIEWER
jgi:hypothetical protein